MEDKKNLGLEARREYLKNEQYNSLSKFVNRTLSDTRKNYDKINTSSIEKMNAIKIKECLKILVNNKDRYTFFEKKDSMMYLLLDAPLFNVDVYYNQDLTYNEILNEFEITYDNPYSEHLIAFNNSYFIDQVLKIDFIKNYLRNKNIDTFELKELIIEHIVAYIKQTYMDN